MKKILLSLLVSCLLISCVDTANTKITKEAELLSSSRDDLQRSTLKQLALQTIVPMYQQFYEGSVLLSQDAAIFCLHPNQKQFERVRNSWGQTLTAWQRTDALLFGPAIEDQIDFSIYFYPVKKNIINALLIAQNKITTTKVEQAGIAGQGLATMEYLLFDRDSSNKKIIEKFLNQSGKKRCEYLNATAVLLQQQAKIIYHAWHPEHGNFAEAFSRAGLDSLIYTEPQQPWAELTNKIFQAVEKISISRVAIPLGKKSGSQVKPYKLEAWRSGHTLASIKASIQGLERLFSGGLMSWLSQNGHQTTVQKLTHTFASLNQQKLPENDLFHLLQTNPEIIEPFYREVKVLTQIIKNDFAVAMGVQLGFNDNDGD